VVDAFRHQKLCDAGVGRGREGDTGRSQGQGRGLEGGEGVDPGVGGEVGPEAGDEGVGGGLTAGRGVGQEPERLGPEVSLEVGPEVDPGPGPEVEVDGATPDRIPDPFRDQGLGQVADDNGKMIKSGKNRIYP